MAIVIFSVTGIKPNLQFDNAGTLPAAGTMVGYVFNDGQINFQSKILDRTSLVDAVRVERELIVRNQMKEKFSFHTIEHSALVENVRSENRENLRSIWGDPKQVGDEVNDDEEEDEDGMLGRRRRRRLRRRTSWEEFKRKHGVNGVESVPPIEEVPPHLVELVKAQIRQYQAENASLKDDIDGLKGLLKLAISPPNSTMFTPPNPGQTNSNFPGPSINTFASQRMM